MFITVNQTATQLGRVRAGDIIINTGNVPVYLADDVVTVNNAPNVGSIVYAGGQLVWDHDSYPLWGRDPSGNSPTVQITNGSQDQNTGLLASSDVPIALFPYAGVNTLAGVFPTPIPVNMAVMNVARFASLKVNCSAASTGTAAQNYYDVVFKWSNDPSFSAFSSIIDEETFGFEGGGQMVAGHVVVRGPYLQIELRNYDSISKLISIGVFGSNRIEARSQFHNVTHSVPLNEGNGTDNVLVADQTGSIAAGVTTDFGSIGFYNGPVTARFRITNAGSPAKKTVQVALNAQPAGAFNATSHLQWSLPDDAGIAANLQPITVNFTLPRRVCNFVVTNNDSVAHSVGYTIFAQEL